jgi:hypothetical protein
MAKQLNSRGQVGVILLVIAIVLVLGVGSYFVIKNVNNPTGAAIANQAQNNPSTQTNTNTQTPTNTVPLSQPTTPITSGGGGGGSSGASVGTGASVPRIIINGSASITVQVGSAYNDAGATATDTSSGQDLTSSIVTTGSVDTHTIGIYTITYTVSSSGGEQTTQIRTVNVVDTTAPTLTVAGFTADGSAMSGNMVSGFVLNTNNNADKSYSVQFSSGSLASENLKTETVGLYLQPTTGQTDALRTYYLTKPVPYQEYLDAAAVGTQPFAYIKTGGTNVQLLDGAQYTLASVEKDMIIPDNYPLGTYTVSGKIHDLAGNEQTVTFILIVAGDRVAPSLSVTGFTDNGNNMAGDLTQGYTLVENTATIHVVEFQSSSVTDESLANEPIGLYLISSSVSPSDLTTYYQSLNKPTDYFNYLVDAANGQKPFAYITADLSNNLVLHDAAQYDLAGNHDVGMVIPGNYPKGTYVVSGEVKDLAGNSRIVTFDLIIA